MGLRSKGLVRDFKGGIRAVDGIDLQVAPGEIYGFLGPNGAGKSTTVLVLTTLLPPTAGQVRVAGLDVVRQGAEVRRARNRAARTGRPPGCGGSQGRRLLRRHEASFGPRPRAGAPSWAPTGA
jgi:ABC-type uncharacterized transport system ATPase subunit